MENRRIKDNQLRATSALSLAEAIHARLNAAGDGYGGWCPDQAGYGNKTGPFYTQFIQVKLDTPLRIKGIVTQGRASGVEKVEQYWINYTPNEKTGSWKWIYDEKIKNVKVRNIKSHGFQRFQVHVSTDKCM